MNADTADFVGAYEAKTQLPRLLDEVAAGKSYVITKHGVPVARMSPVETLPRDAKTVIDELRATREGVTAGNMSIRKMIEEGRR